MSNFRNILVYAETADAGCLAEVVTFAEEAGATLSVCDVIAAAPEGSGTMARLKALAWSLAFERLRGLCAPHQGRVPLDYAVLTGNPFLAITEQVTRQAFDLVVHISEAGANEAGAALNPTGMHLVRKCPAAVWALHPGAARSSDGILLALDRETTADGAGAARFLRDLAATACGLARARATTLHLVHAWQPYGEALLAHPRAGLSSEEIGVYLEAQATEHARWFRRLTEDLASRAPDVVIETHLECGAPVSVVPEMAHRTGAGLIVLGTVGSRALPGVLIGTTTEALLAAAKTPILALKPAGFRSPIQFTAPGPAPTAGGTGGGTA